MTAWRAYVSEIVTAWGWSLSDGQISALEQVNGDSISSHTQLLKLSFQIIVLYFQYDFKAWKDAQDTDENSASMIEIARFLLSSYNIFLH